MRVGAFVFESQAAFLTENLIAPLRIPKEETTEKMVELNGSCVAKPIRSGIWLAGKFMSTQFHIKYVKRLQESIIHVSPMDFILFLQIYNLFVAQSVISIRVMVSNALCYLHEVA